MYGRGWPTWHGVAGKIRPAQWPARIRPTLGLALSGVNGASPAAEIARSPAAWERIAKDWLLELIERAPLAELETLPLTWISQQAPPLIAEILGQLSDPGAARNLELPPSAQARAAALGSGDADRIPRDLAALQGVLIEALARQARTTDKAAFTQAVARLAEVFGAVQSAVLKSLLTPGPVVQPSPVAKDGIPGAAELDEWLGILVRRHRDSGAPLAVARLEVEGVERILAGYGRDAADQMLSAVAGIVAGRIDPADRIFHLHGNGFAILAPGTDAITLGATIGEIAAMVERSQGRHGPRVSVVAGIAPLDDGEASPEQLLEAGEEALWTARAEGRPFAVARRGALQDP